MQFANDLNLDFSKMFLFDTCRKNLKNDCSFHFLPHNPTSNDLDKESF